MYYGEDIGYSVVILHIKWPTLLLECLEYYFLLNNNVYKPTQS